MKTPKIIETLAEKIMEAHKKQVAEDSMQKYLEENLRDTEKAISNLISCMEQGIVSNSTKQRLLELSRFTLFRNCKEQNDNVTSNHFVVRFVLRRNSVLPDLFSFYKFSANRVTVTRRALAFFIFKIRRAVVIGDISGQQLRIRPDLR